MGLKAEELKIQKKGWLSIAELKLESH